MKKRALWIVTIGFSLGVLWRSFFDWGFAPVILVLVCALASVLLCVVQGKHAKVFLIITLTLCSVAGGMLRFALDDETHKPDVLLTQHVQSTVVFEGVVSDEPEDRDTYTRLVVDVDTVDIVGETTHTTVRDRVLVYAPRYPKVQYGDRVRIKGVLENPEPIVEDDERVFLFQEYLKKDGIHFVVSYPKLEVLEHENHASLHGILFSVKHSFLDALKTMLPEPHASLLGGLVVGAKEALGTELLDQFRKVGIVHIVVLSGYNIAVIAKAVMSVLSWLPRMAGWGIGSVFIILFTILTGGSATIVRASIMALLVFFAEASGRKFDALRALIAAAMCMIIQNPRILAFDPSFQLSFLATFGLITLSPSIERILGRVPKLLGMREILAATLSTELAVLPLLLWMTGMFSIVAPMVNILILPTIPFVMLAGFVTGVVALMSTTIAIPFSIVTYAILSYELLVVKIFAALPFAAVHAPHFSVLVMFVVYFLSLFLFRKFLFQKQQKQKVLHQNEMQ